jgi:hypothetical protein
VADRCPRPRPPAPLAGCHLPFRWHALRKLYEATTHTPCLAPDGVARSYWACMQVRVALSSRGADRGIDHERA